MILNNCTTCGFKPLILRREPVPNDENFHCFCACCGKCVYSDSAIWPKETAADMWNRANPVEEETMHDNEVNRIAHDLAKMGSVIYLVGGELCIGYPIALTDNARSDRFYIQMDVSRYETELTEFYRKRLEPATTT